ncbi:MAG TPA: Trk system potassium transporter TrkA [Candidatus Rifleibacterium sp.]|nr:Trk system potassium transporter TrkA [Candidatus Rifleibacterium sp.]HPT44901.1 Trk system potassium transporter TrkA [Candidatus Rifleibacterium sp.]
MKIVISGGSEIGMLFARTLAGKNDVHVIESAPHAVEQLEQLDLQLVNGNPTSLAVLQETNVADADAFIGCAHSDEVNVISCLAVKHLGKAQTFCFVNKAHYFETFAGELGEHLAIDRLIWPEMLLGEYIAQILTVPGAIDVKVFEHEDLKLLEFRLKTGNSAVGKKVKDLGIPRGALAVAIFRDDQVIIPNGLTTLYRNDKIIFIGHEASMRKIESRFNPNPGRTMNVVIVGGGNVGFILAKALEPFSHFKVRIIEKSLPQCQLLTERLSESILVMHADGTDVTFLRSQQVENCDCLVAVTGNDERNLFVSMHAKALNVKKVITRAHSSDNIEFFEKLGIDVALSSQLNAVQSVCRQISDDSIDVLTIFEKGKAEIREVVVPADFPPSRLMDLKLPEGVIIAAIRRGGHTLVPGGEDKLKEKDHLRVFCSKDQGKTLAEFLAETVRTAVAAQESEDGR